MIYPKQSCTFPVIEKHTLHLITKSVTIDWLLYYNLPLNSNHPCKAYKTEATGCKGLQVSSAT